MSTTQLMKNCLNKLSEDKEVEFKKKLRADVPSVLLGDTIGDDATAQETVNTLVKAFNIQPALKLIIDILEKIHLTKDADKLSKDVEQRKALLLQAPCECCPLEDDEREDEQYICKPKKVDDEYCTDAIPTQCSLPIETCLTAHDWLSNKDQLFKLGSHEFCKRCLSETQKEQCPVYRQILELDPQDPQDEVQAVSEVSPHETVSPASIKGVRINTEVYQIDSKPRGICLIISNKDFGGPRNRDGTERDVESLLRVFSRLGFRVLLCVDKTAQQMKEVLEAISKLDREQLEVDQVKLERLEGVLSSYKKEQNKLKELNSSSKQKQRLLEVQEEISNLEREQLAVQENISNLMYLHTLLCGLYEYNGDRGDFIPLKELPQHGDAFVCCLLSHGGKIGVCGVDSKELPIEQILSLFNGENCSTLNCKPKAFFIQACRGKRRMRGTLEEVDISDVDYDASPTTKPEKQWSFIATEADFLVVRSTVQNYVSMRHRKYGSIFIQCLCSQLISDLSPRGENILNILTKVNYKVAKEDHDNITYYVKQVSETSFTLRKSLVFPVQQCTLTPDERITCAAPPPQGASE